MLITVTICNNIITDIIPLYNNKSWKKDSCLKNDLIDTIYTGIDVSMYTLMYYDIANDLVLQ